MGMYDQYLFRSPLLEDYDDYEYIDTTPIYYNEEYNCFVDDYGNIYVLDEGFLDWAASKVPNSVANIIPDHWVPSQQPTSNKPLITNRSQYSQRQKVGMPQNIAGIKKSAFVATLGHYIDKLGPKATRAMWNRSQGKSYNLKDLPSIDNSESRQRDIDRIVRLGRL